MFAPGIVMHRQQGGKRGDVPAAGGGAIQVVQGVAWFQFQLSRAGRLHVGLSIAPAIHLPKTRGVTTHAPHQALVCLPRTLSARPRRACFLRRMESVKLPVSMWTAAEDANFGLLTLHWFFSDEDEAQTPATIRQGKTPGSSGRCKAKMLNQLRAIHPPDFLEGDVTAGNGQTYPASPPHFGRGHLHLLRRP